MAFSSARRWTLVGSMMPAFTRSTYSPFAERDRHQVHLEAQHSVCKFGVFASNLTVPLTCVVHKRRSYGPSSSRMQVDDAPLQSVQCLDLVLRQGTVEDGKLIEEPDVIEAEPDRRPGHIPRKRFGNPGDRSL